MEEEIAPVVENQPPEISVQPPKKNNLLTIVIPACRQAGCLIAILLVGIGGVYAGIQIGKKQVMMKPSPVIPTIIPTQVLEPTTIPTQVPETTNIPTLDETANWKTYRNEEYVFEFKYPKQYLIEQHLENIYDPLLFFIEVFRVSDREKRFQNPQPVVYLNIFKDDGLVLNEWLEKHGTTSELWGPNKEIFFDNISNLKNCDYPGSSECKRFYSGSQKRDDIILLHKGGFIYQICLRTLNSTVAEAEFDQILSTFKFID